MWTKKVSDLKVIHELEIKSLQCSRMVANIRGALGINLQRTLRLWQVNSVEVEYLEEEYEDYEEQQNIFRQRSVSEYEKR